MLVNSPNNIKIVKAEDTDSKVDIESLIENSEENFSKKEMGEIENDIDIMESLGVLEEARNVEIESTKENDFEYEVEYKGVVNNISDIDYTAEGVSFKSEQDDINDTVEIREDGKIFLNGEEIEYSSVDNEVGANECLVVANDSQRWFQKKCPYGKASDYSVSGGTSKCSDINLKRAIKDISMSAVIAIICAVCGAGAIASFCAGAAYTFICEYRPSAKGLSYKVKKYYNKNTYHWWTGAYISAIRKSVMKYSYTWYTKYNYKGKKCYNTAYWMKEQY